MLPASERLREQRIFHSPLIDLGVFHADAGSGLFGPQASPGHFTIAFPETSVRIRPSHGRAFVTDRNLVTLYEPADTYERGLVDPRGDRCTFLSPEPAVAQEFAEHAGLTDGDGRLFRQAFERCPAPSFARQRNLVRRLRQGDGLPAATVEEEALAILDGVAAHSVDARRASPKPVNPAARRHVHRAQEYLATHYALAPGLSDIAAAAGCSPYHLSRVFRRHFGTTLHRYRTGLAIRDAYDQIVRTDRRLLDIALDLGFASHSHFSGAFVSVFGIVPSSLRRSA